MNVNQIYNEDLQIANALIKRDELTTRKFFYNQCYPLFKSIFDNYYTDCVNCKEFIDEIYLLVLSPSKTTGRCQMENFRGESTLASWLKTSCLFYCYNKFEIKERMPRYEKITLNNEKEPEDDDRNDSIIGSLEIDFSKLNFNDVISLLKQMPNKRYSELIRLRYLEQNTNEETANLLGMTIDNYYNKHKLAKEQFKIIQKKEANNE